MKGIYGRNIGLNSKFLTSEAFNGVLLLHQSIYINTLINNAKSRI